MNEITEPTELQAFDENPFSRTTVKPEDIVRIFYTHNVPVLPVISRRDILLGCLFKEDVIAELSDIERTRNTPIDAFITRIARKVNLDDILPFGKVRTFKTVNLYGELQRDWARIELFNACERGPSESAPAAGEPGKESEQSLEWMIYMILEHLPRALYAVNRQGGTIFYNGHFEELYNLKHEGEVDHSLVEKWLKSTKNNEPSAGKRNGDLLFFNTDLSAWYEKVPMKHEGKTSGYLVLFHRDDEAKDDFRIAGNTSSVLSLEEILLAAEKKCIQISLDRHETLVDAAGELGIGVKQLAGRMKKLGLAKKGS